jgi:arylsulfatase A-like enzyme
MAELVDIYPTLSELAGLPPPTFVSGVSLAAAVHNPSIAVRQAAVSQVSRLVSNMHLLYEHAE